jgi:hypothetical protein
MQHLGKRARATKDHDGHILYETTHHRPMCCVTVIPNLRQARFYKHLSSLFYLFTNLPHGYHGNVFFYYYIILCFPS